MTCQLSLRPANIADSEILYRWRNDPLTRAQSHTGDLVKPEEHYIWLDASLSNPNRRIWIAIEDGNSVGTIRADLNGDGWLLSWSVAPEHRGRHVGHRLLLACVALLPRPLRAEIKAGNIASQKIAEAAGFVLTHTLEDITCWQLE